MFNTRNLPFLSEFADEEQQSRPEHQCLIPENDVIGDILAALTEHQLTIIITAPSRSTNRCLISATPTCKLRTTCLPGLLQASRAHSFENIKLGVVPQVEASFHNHSQVSTPWKNLHLLSAASWLRGLGQ